MDGFFSFGNFDVFRTPRGVLQHVSHQGVETEQHAKRFVHGENQNGSDGHLQIWTTTQHPPIENGNFNVQDRVKHRETDDQGKGVQMRQPKHQIQPHPIDDDVQTFLKHERFNDPGPCPGKPPKNHFAPIGHEFPLVAQIPRRHPLAKENQPML